MRFAWRDGPFLKALKSGDWILLDEVNSFILFSSLYIQVLSYQMNLASQSVLEGLNACLDHRGDVSITICSSCNMTCVVPGVHS